MIKNLKLEMKRHKTVKPSYVCYQPRQPQNSNLKNYKQSTHIIPENLHTLNIYLLFRSCHFLLHLDVNVLHCRLRLEEFTKRIAVHFNSTSYNLLHTYYENMSF